MNELALFAGGGGGILGGHLLGWKTVCAVEIEKHAQRVLLRRQLDGVLPQFPIWDDVRTFDGRPWRGRVGVVSGGFPCQDISLSGKGAGLAGERSGLWFEMLRVIGEVRPGFVFVENAAALNIRGLLDILKGIASMGYNARWGTLGADAIGLPHHRARLWVVAYSPEEYGYARDMLGSVAWESQGELGRLPGIEISADWTVANQGPFGCSVFRHPADGTPAEVDELAALGNAQVPAVAATAFQILSEGLIKKQLNRALPTTKNHDDEAIFRI